MLLATAYRKRSTLTPSASGMALSLSPNLRRDRVSFSGLLRQPLRFREAISALHDVVVSDLRYVPKDKTAYEAFKKQMADYESRLRTKAVATAMNQPLGDVALPPDLQSQYHKLREMYWNARIRYSSELQRSDPQVWRLLVPCDPVITVSPDVVFFECFSKDESSYGCLSIERDGFEEENEVAQGTTNVDYSWALYDHFQEMRSYRETRFFIDPQGFEVSTESMVDADTGYREEKIDLPSSWLRGFSGLQSAMSLPTRKVSLTREAIYAVLAHLKRHRAAKSPRAIRFELKPGEPVRLVLEPWEKPVPLPTTIYAGPVAENVRIWGRDRLQLLARLLPLIDRAEVHLPGNGLPSFWVIRMGPMVFTLGLSGWTANDWTGGSAIEALAPPGNVPETAITAVGQAFRASPRLSLAEVVARTGLSPGVAMASLNRLAGLGQVIHDLSAEVYRWRQIMPVALSAEILGPDHPETQEGRNLFNTRAFRLESDVQETPSQRVVTGTIGATKTSLTMDVDGRISAGKCGCSFYYQGGLRRGPCRHMQCLRHAVMSGDKPRSWDAWYDWLRRG